MTSGRVSTVVAIALLAAVLAGYWAVHVHLDPPPERDRWIHDISRYFHPSAVYMHNELRAGRLPIWNPHQMAGMPFLATHIAGPLYPGNLALLALFSPARAIEVHAVVHLLLAGVLTWLFARRLRLGTSASLAAAFSYMFSGALMALFYSVAYVSTCTWLPGVMLATHALVEERRVRWAIALAFALAMAFLGGHAQGFLFEAQIAGAYGLVLLVGGSRENWVRAVALAAAAGVLLVGIVAVQLLPTLEMLDHVPRAVEGLSLAEAGEFGTQPSEVVGGLLGRGGRFSVTVLALPLLLLGLFDRPRRRSFVFFSVAAVLCGLFAMGDRTPVLRLYHMLPAGDLFRFPYRIAFVYAFCLSCGVGFGVAGAQALARRLRPGSARLPAAVGVLLVAAVVVDLGVWRRFERALPIPVEESSGASTELVAALEGRWNEGRLFIENFGKHHTPLLPYLSGMMMGGFVVPTYEPMIPLDYGEAFRQDRLWRGFVNVVPAPREFSWTRAAGPADFPAGGLLRILDLMSVRFYAAHAELAGGRIAALERAVGGHATRVGDAWMLERNGALPRAYVVHDVIVERDPERAWQRMLAPDFDPHSFVVAEEAIPGISPADANGLERAEIRSQVGERVEVDASCAASCLLVLTDYFYPGWEARVDAEPASLYRVNALFRAVVIPPGTHRVVYDYRPHSFRLGAAVSVATLGLLVLGSGVTALRSRSGNA